MQGVYMRYDVLRVDLATKVVTVLERDKSQQSAALSETVAVMRSGVENQFFVTAPTGQYNDGDVWTG